MNAPTPMMLQYLEAKNAAPGALLLFRMGDFYEIFFDDAKTAARLLGLALTSRDKGENAIPMAGFPYPALDAYLAKLIAAGQRVAIAEQVEDPKLAKGLVKRELTRIVTPGTLTDDALLDPRESNFLAALVPGKTVGLAWVELSTGRFSAADFPPERLLDELARIGPAEILLGEQAAVPEDLDGPGRPWLTTRTPQWHFEARTAVETILKQFGVATLEGWGWRETGPALTAAAGLLHYLQDTQRTALPHLDRLLPYDAGRTLRIDEAARRSLELFRAGRDQRRDTALLGVIDRTRTAPGARLLADWLANPLTDGIALEERLDAVGELIAEPRFGEDLEALLRQAYDLERLLARVTTGRATPRDLGFLSKTLRLLPQLERVLEERAAAIFRRCRAELDLCPELRLELEAALVDDCPLNSKEGGILRDGYHAELDRLRDLAAGGRQWIAAYQAREAERTGISNLKVAYNKVFGYYIELTASQLTKAPPEYKRKQTIKNAERYITPELETYQHQILGAVDKAQTLEYELFVQLREQVAAQARRLQAAAKILAELDVLRSFAATATARGWCRPELVEEPILDIVEGRHPVLDALLPEGTFVPNDIRLGPSDGRILLITGPNMAGKSTCIRQTALIVILAHMGSYVPAKRARIGLTDRVFARVGAGDELARGQSTFMVEMTETARILHQATERSLVILDEIGRGTSTYDGVSLAWSVVEHLHQEIGCRTLFATHYHELTQLAEELPDVRNASVAVQEWGDKLVFLHKIVPGPADRSYGLHVARLAGVPQSVIDRAGRILAHLEADHVPHEERFRTARRKSRPAVSSGHRYLFLVEPETAAESPAVSPLPPAPLAPAAEPKPAPRRRPKGAV